MGNAPQGKCDEISEGLGRAALVEPLRSGGAAQDGDDLQVDQLWCSELLAVQALAVAVGVIVGEAGARLTRP